MFPLLGVPQCVVCPLAVSLTRAVTGHWLLCSVGRAVGRGGPWEGAGGAPMPPLRVLSVVLGWDKGTHWGKRGTRWGCPIAPGSGPTRLSPPSCVGLGVSPHDSPLTALGLAQVGGSPLPSSTQSRHGPWGGGRHPRGTSGVREQLGVLDPLDGGVPGWVGTPHLGVLGCRAGCRPPTPG